MESRSQKPFVLIFLLGLLVLFPNLGNWQDSATTSTPVIDEQLLQVAKHHPHLLFQAIQINRAGAEQLCIIPGLGVKLSERIVLYRATHGPFLSWDELGRVNGIGPQKLAKIKLYCRL